MGPIQIVVVLIVIGVLLWLVNTYIPMASPIKTIINALVILFVCLWLLNAFGLLSGGPYIGNGNGRLVR
jgi:hypothetical protein